MTIMDLLEEQDKRRDRSKVSTDIRTRALMISKSFKKSWVDLGQVLYTIHRDKLYHGWGFEKFEDYAKNELGLNGQVAMKMLKSYLYVEEDEPAYLKENYAQERAANQVPSFDQINVLRLAKNNKDLSLTDFRQLKKAVFDKGRDAAAIRKDLVSLMKERKPVDPDHEREIKNEASIKRIMQMLKMFKKDMETYKMVPYDIIEETQVLMDKLNEQLS